MSVELGRGKKYFPGMTAIGLWLGWAAHMCDLRRFERSLETALRIAGRRALAVMPVLFNRWRSRHLDYGGIYLDHFVPGASWPQRTKDPLRPYMQSIVGGHARDTRIFAWDFCNEPFTYNSPESPAMKPVRGA